MKTFQILVRTERGKNESFVEVAETAVAALSMAAVKWEWAEVPFGVTIAEISITEIKPALTKIKLQAQEGNKMRFKKGQKVYSAETHLATRYGKGDEKDIHIMTVVERTVDACGNKQMTFYNAGNDFIFGKKVCAPFNKFFETRELAYEYLNKFKQEKQHFRANYEIMIGEYSDQDKKVFEDCRRLYPNI